MSGFCLRCANCAAPDPCDGRVDEDGHCDMYTRAERADSEKRDHPPTEQAVPGASTATQPEGGQP
jgi:hypothetical protein